MHMNSTLAKIAPVLTAAFNSLHIWFISCSSARENSLKIKVFKTRLQGPGDAPSGTGALNEETGQEIVREVLFTKYLYH